MKRTVYSGQIQYKYSEAKESIHFLTVHFFSYYSTRGLKILHRLKKFQAYFNGIRNNRSVIMMKIVWNFLMFQMLI